MLIDHAGRIAVSQTSAVHGAPAADRAPRELERHANGCTAARSLADARPHSYWLDDPGRPEACPALVGDDPCDLLVVGGGYSGLWTALIAKERDPGRDVVLVEGRGSAGPPPGATAASAPPPSPTAWLTASSASRRMGTLVRLGGRTSTRSRRRSRVRDRLRLRAHRQLNVATAEWQANDLREYAAVAGEYGERVEFLERRRGHAPR